VIQSSSLLACVSGDESFELLYWLSDLKILVEGNCRGSFVGGSQSNAAPLMSGACRFEAATGGSRGPIPAMAIKGHSETVDKLGTSKGEPPNGHLVVNGTCDGVESPMAELRLKADDTNENTAQETTSDSKTEAVELKDRTKCRSDKKPAENLKSDDVTSETKASERGLSSSDSGGGEIPKEICDAVREEGSSGSVRNSDVSYHIYENELNMPDIMRLIQKDLSEPYSIYTYRYFIHNWPNLCFMARVGDECVGAIVCKLDYHKKVVKRGYIAMLAVDSKFRKRAIGSTLVQKAIEAMNAQEADEVVLETEITNRPALRLYENLGFVRDKRLFRYYLNGVDALRLKLWLR